MKSKAARQREGLRALRLVLLGCLLALGGLAVALFASSARAEGGGGQPSEAPLIAVGQTYIGNSADHQPNGEGVDFWLLPPLLTDDVVTVAWQSPTHANFLCLDMEVDDYSWGKAPCNASSDYDVSGTGSERTRLSASHGTSQAFLEFHSCCGLSEAPYNFVVESIQHAIGVNLTPVTSVAADGSLDGSAGLANGTPVPNGLSFTLSAAWQHGQAQYGAISSSGKLAFQLALPAETAGKPVTFTITRPADAQYQEAKSASQKITVQAPPAPPPACVVPSLGTRRLGSVERRIRAAHCTVDLIRHVHSRLRRGQVVGLSPRSGTRLTSGAFVAIVVSSGPKDRRRRRASGIRKGA